MRDGAIEFEEWRRYVFTRCAADFRVSAHQDSPEALAWAERESALSNAEIAAFIATVFERSEEIPGLFTRPQVCDGTLSLFGITGAYFVDVRQADVPPALQERVYAGIPRMYAEVYELMCGAAALTGRGPEDALDSAVSMIWDSDCMDGVLHFEREAHLHEPVFEALQWIVMECQREPCVQSGLHGLGHAVRIHGGRATAIIDEFLRVRGAEVSPVLLEYARRAIKEDIQ